MFRYLTLFFILFLIHLQAIDINHNTSQIQLLQQSYIFIDSTSDLSKQEVLQKEFKPIKTDSINFGIIPKKTIWIKFSLHNTTDQPFTKILEYANIKPEEVILYDQNRSYKDGLFYHTRSSMRPTFALQLKPNETKEYLISAHSKTTALIAKLTLWSPKDFYNYDMQEKLFIMAFFTIFLTLLLYNFIIYLFTKDIVYLYYTLYLFGVIVFEFIYLGIGQIYFFSNEVTVFITKATLLSVLLLLVPMILFTEKLLQIQKINYKIFIGLRLYLYLFPIIAVLGYDNFLFDLDALVLLLPLIILMVLAGYYSYKEGIKEALLYLIGWGFVLLTLIFAILQSLGIFNIFDYFRRTTELAFAFEVFIFSIAVAYRLKRLDQEKTKLNQKLFELQKDEQKRLEKLIALRTQELELSVEEKEVLYKELQHRVKNNLSFIVSLLDLQILQSNSELVQTELHNTTSRINSFAKMYQLLLVDQKHSFQTTENYFKEIVEKIQEQFELDIIISYEINTKVKEDLLIYYGLILNELVTNSFKHAFSTAGTINVKLYKQKEKLYFVVADDGVGYKETSNKNLGSTIVETLVKKQLKGTISIENNDGTKVTISSKIR